jgi:hypothetical protein
MAEDLPEEMAEVSRFACNAMHCKHGGKSLQLTKVSLRE